ncbi:pirin family protein [Caulobacter sp. 17J65-9]|uniref:pirin family protein n=1 Tax=Caulobacter sp. 17J65-9 TaxID=2709382 RepID=UPI0013CA6951|nr:pirin family protein [Caulobacter sp. 17J65-9]NEX92384.1 pirin family protein [Caulobacter sp. 17J65-9]
MIELVVDARKKDLGGFEVGRVLPFAERRMVGPFIFLDHMGPADFEPGHGVDVRPHPHIGLSTVTYLFEGELVHRDSLGSHLSIQPGEVNWMTAGKGISHSERTDPYRREIGARLHGMQAWLALPTEHEEDEPAFDHYTGADLMEYHGEGLYARLIAGEAYGAKSKVKTHSPLFYVHWEMAAGVKSAPPKGHSERAAYVVKGAIEIDGRRFDAGQMIVFEKNADAVVTALTPATVMLLGGEPVGERLIWWNFVSSSKERMEQAKADWKEGRFALPPQDDKEFIPLPEEEPPVQQASEAAEEEVQEAVPETVQAVAQAAG